MKNLSDAAFLFKVFDLSLKYDIAASITDEIKGEIWARNSEKDVWPFVAGKELEVC